MVGARRTGGSQLRLLPTPMTTRGSTTCLLGDVRRGVRCAAAATNAIFSHDFRVPSSDGREKRGFSRIFFANRAARTASASASPRPGRMPCQRRPNATSSAVRTSSAPVCTESAAATNARHVRWRPRPACAGVVRHDARSPALHGADARNRRRDGRNLTSHIMMWPARALRGIRPHDGRNTAYDLLHTLPLAGHAVVAESRLTPRCSAARHDAQFRAAPPLARPTGRAFGPSASLSGEGVTWPVALARSAGSMLLRGRGSGDRSGGGAPRDGDTRRGLIALSAVGGCSGWPPARVRRRVPARRLPAASAIRVQNGGCYRGRSAA